jgi:small-conductance mechanosensitive channel
MNLTEIKLFETGLAIVLYFLIRFALIKLVDSTVAKSLLHKTRGKIIKKVFHILLTTITLLFILIVWGVDQSELLLFMTSVLAVIGIALFAQWSHLSNLTAGIIIFFNHSAKLDDTVTIVDKDYEVEGRISDIGLFFIKIKTKQDEEVSFPNNIFLQKMVKKKISS